MKRWCPTHKPQVTAGARPFWVCCPSVTDVSRQHTETACWLRHSSAHPQNRLLGRLRPEKSLSLGLQPRENPLQFFLYLLSVYVGMCVYACTHMGHGTYVEVRRTCKSQLSSFTRWSWRLILGHQAWQQAPVPTGPSGWPRDPPLSKKIPKTLQVPSKAST